MLMLPVRQFEPEDADIICPNAIDVGLHNKSSGWPQWAELVNSAGPAFTALYEGEPVISAGVYIFDDKYEHAGWAWAIFSPKVKQCKKRAFRSVYTMLRILMDKFDLNFVISNSRKGFGASQRLLEHLGFRRMDKETNEHYFYFLGFS